MHINDDLLDLINPKKDSRFSSNLFKWLKKHKSQNIGVAFQRTSVLDDSVVEYDAGKNQMSQLILFYGDLDDGYAHGARLSEIVCNGTRAKSFAYNVAIFDLVNVDEFFTREDGWFDQYEVKGKCWLDPEHLVYFERWVNMESARHCDYCGHKQIRHIEMVPKERWIDATELEKIA